MNFIRYVDTEAFAADTLDILLKHEVQNNLPISFINNDTADKSNWLLGSVKDDSGSVVIVAACTPPYNIVLFETDNNPNDTAVQFLANELKSLGIKLPGVLAEQSLALRFSEAYANAGFHRHLSMNVMQLDKVNSLEKAPGYFRLLSEDDLFFAPYWARAFGEECRVEVFDIPTYVEQIKSRINKESHYFWVDGHPVSQAVHGRSTQNGAVINAVYTPPNYRGKGYATTLVAELSQELLNKGNKFCCLFADAENPTSCGIYRKIGYYDLCVYDEIKFQF
jgi:predicted GNAT family acetyltransferase